MNDITEIKGIGPKIKKHFNDLGIYEKKDFLSFFPRDYEAYEEPKKIIDLEIGKVVTVEAIVASRPTIFRKKNITISSVWLDDGSGKIRAYWFNSPFITKNIVVGKKAYFRGKVSVLKNGIALSQCKIFNSENYAILKNTLNPIYTLTKGITNSTIKKIMQGLLIQDEKFVLKEYIPDIFVKKRKLCDLTYAYKHIHFPDTYEDMLCARKRLAYDELFIFSLTLLLNKEKKIREGRKEFKDIDNSIVLDIKKKLPYTLTNDQEMTVKSILDDFKAGKKLNRLVEGDVGSGKTIVAIIIAALIAKKNIQTAFMAPTEILAEQHYNTICKLVIDCVLPKNLNVAFLTGNTKAKERKIILENLKTGKIDIIVGTHALFSEDVLYADLGLCIIDEQHRFGVEQRKALEEKSKNAGIIAMSATPIPRTLAMLIYADMDISYIKEKPKNRLPIKNCIIGIKDREKGYKAIKKEIDAGHQAYVICAAIENDDDIGNFANYQNVKNYAKTLNAFFGKTIKIDVLHGKMSSDEKELVMKKFKDGEIDILVATTVVEVGVDVPNATFMMIEDAGYFGLATLHQLRGRVGRGKFQSYALFVDTEPTEKTKERLNVLLNSNDGFYIAEQDLRLRGPGDVFGIRQSGSISFKIADMYVDYQMFKFSQVDAKEFIDKKYDFSEELKNKINSNMEKSYII